MAPSKKAPPKTPLMTQVDRLVTAYGGLRKAARALDMDPPHLWRIWRGKSPAPTAETLKKLGLERSDTYRRIGG